MILQQAEPVASEVIPERGFQCKWKRVAIQQR